MKTSAKNKNLRALIIKGMTRKQLINFIKQKNSFYFGASFAGHSDEQLRNIAIEIDAKTIAEKIR